MARKGDLVYNTMRMWQGVSGVAPGDCIVSPAYVVCEPNSLIDPCFSAYLFKHDRMIRILEGHSQGITADRLRLYFHHFGKIRVALPPIPEQKKIAAILSSVDEAIQATQAVIEQTRRVKEGLLQELLTRGIGHTRFKQTPIGEIPERWEVLRLSSLCSITHGYAFQGEFFTDEETDFHLLTPGNFAVGGGYQPHKNRFYRGEVDPTYVLSAGDLMVTMTDLTPGCQTLGLPLLVPSFRSYRALHNQRLGLVEIGEPELLSKDYLYAFLLSEGYRSVIRKTASGTTVRHTSPTKILSTEIPLPPKDEQARITKTLASFDTSEDSCTALLESHRTTKAGLLQYLLTGKVRVSV
jgi:type I restriction enzyme S subunit